MWWVDPGWMPENRMENKRKYDGKKLVSQDKGSLIQGKVKAVCREKKKDLFPTSHQQAMSSHCPGS